MSLRSLSQQPPVIQVKCDRLQPRIEFVTGICHLRKIPLGHVADIFGLLNSENPASVVVRLKTIRPVSVDYVAISTSMSLID